MTAQPTPAMPTEFRDHREGRGWPEPGRGGLRWRRFGRAVRYLMPTELAPARSEEDR